MFESWMEFLFGRDDIVQAVGFLGALGIGAGFGLLKNLFVDQPRAEKQKKLAGTTAELSPFTGLKPDLRGTQAASPLETVAQFGATGIALQQNAAQAQAVRDLIKKGGGNVNLEAGGGNAAQLAAIGLGASAGGGGGVIQPTLLPPGALGQLALAGTPSASTFSQLRAGGF